MHNRHRRGGDVRKRNVRGNHHDIRANHHDDAHANHHHHCNPDVRRCDAWDRAMRHQRELPVRSGVRQWRLLHPLYE